MIDTRNVCQARTQAVASAGVDIGLYYSHDAGLLPCFLKLEDMNPTKFVCHGVCAEIPREINIDASSHSVHLSRLVWGTLLRIQAATRAPHSGWYPMVSYPAVDPCSRYGPRAFVPYCEALVVKLWTHLKKRRIEGPGSACDRLPKSRSD